MKGYKVFNSDWTCQGFQYEVGKTYEMPVESVSLCHRGFHYCGKLADCFDYYAFDPNNKVAEIEAEPIGKADLDSKCVTNKITIVREITWAEALILCNSGSGNTGRRNSGNGNSGHWNSGNWNTGRRNSGNWNSGNWNSGHWNSGNWNSGHWNSGNGNSGNWNSGDWNSGNWNSGNWNSGNWNSGNWNSGDWNTTIASSGCFNTEEQNIRMFNKPTVWTLRDWRESYANEVLESIPMKKQLIWVCEEEMTAKDRKDYPEYTTTGGCLKLIEGADTQTWWDGLDYRDKKFILSLPNFDAEIFKQCTGIDVNSKGANDERNKAEQN